MNIVWFKRDLRIFDHAALFGASLKGPIIPIYIFEPELWSLPDMSARQFEFLCESLVDLNHALESLGQPLIIKVGDAVEVLTDIMSIHQIKEVWSHQETWNGWTYKRDMRVKDFLKERNIIWHEPVQNGVVRRLENRDGWSGLWHKFMCKDRIPAPKSLIPLQEKSDPLPTLQDFALEKDGCIYRQKGGRQEALLNLKSFLYERGEGYQKGMSSPLTAFDECSRLSPYLAFGCISIREVFQKTQERAAYMRSLPVAERGKWLSATRSFQGRLAWHCHFIQKLESEPRIEFENMHSVYDEIRGDDAKKYQAWSLGKTGYPFIDACMRALISTGWLNFRMRAMLMSFASFHLWLDWRKTSLHLAKLFTDYEPGIHYPQCQMQSGTTGTNTLRVYNPIKQSMDQDPEGIFIKKWIPELKSLETIFIHEPWKKDHGLDYPAPIVDEKNARKEATQKIYALRKTPEHKTQAKQIIKKHASRKYRIKPKKSFPKQNPKLEQLLLPF